VVERAIAVGDVELAYRPNVLGLLKIELTDFAIGIAAPHLSDVVGSPLGYQNGASPIQKEGGVKPDPRPDFEHALAREWQVQAREVLLPGGIDS